MNDDWNDLKERLEKANHALCLSAAENDQKGRYHEAGRLYAKAEGVRLALDYMRGYQRGYL